MEAVAIFLIMFQTNYEIGDAWTGLYCENFVLGQGHIVRIVSLDMVAAYNVLLCRMF